MSDPTGSGQPPQTHFGFENVPEAQKVRSSIRLPRAMTG